MTDAVFNVVCFIIAVAVVTVMAGWLWGLGAAAALLYIGAGPTWP